MLCNGKQGGSGHGAVWAISCHRDEGGELRTWVELDGGSRAQARPWVVDSDRGDGENGCVT